MRNNSGFAFLSVFICVHLWLNFFRRRIIPLAAPGVAAADALGGEPGAACGAEAGDRFDRILAAGRIVAAMPAEETSERHTVEQHELDQQPSHDGILGGRGGGR